jgi:hypothetical protein
VWPSEVVSLAGAPKGRFASKTVMEAARERCCDVKRRAEQRKESCYVVSPQLNYL